MSQTLPKAVNFFIEINHTFLHKMSNWISKHQLLASCQQHGKKSVCFFLYFRSKKIVSCWSEFRTNRARGKCSKINSFCDMANALTLNMTSRWMTALGTYITCNNSRVHQWRCEQEKTTIQNYQRDALNIIYSSNITLLYMFRVSSTHLQEDIVVHKQHMVLSLSIRVLVSCWYAAIGSSPYSCISTRH